jgi:cold shock CspA family protein
MQQEFIISVWRDDKGYGFARWPEEPFTCHTFFFHRSEITTDGILKSGSRIRGCVVSDRRDHPKLVNVELLDAAAVPAVDENGLEDFVVVYWSHGVGTARPPASHQRNNGLFFRSKNIISSGSETLRPGSLIRGRRVADPKYPEKDSLIDIEIYS